ncbi:universal stress protein [Natribaculum luteum]|uniref:Universal stress protein n=1 Tax=Natribaculum luteum TaxID=1586232 RepID=A0ABD5NUZ0_9EURY|nr:universal stress protein [Natribaculum luteum]
MYDRILVPTDGSETADLAVDHALEVASRHDAECHVLYVADTNEPSLVRIEGSVRDVLESEGEEIVTAAVERARERGVSVRDDVVQGHPAEAICEYATAYEIDLVVMGAHSGDPGQHRLGSVTEQVIRSADVPVLTVREPGALPSYETVLLPTDGSDVAASALEVAVEVADRNDATLHVVSVVDTTGIGFDVLTSPAEAIEATRTVVDDAAERAREEGEGVDVVTAVERGSPWREIGTYVDDHDVDLVVMGTHGRGGIERYLLGSVTEKVVRTSPVPVVTVRSGDRNLESDQ